MIDMSYQGSGVRIQESGFRIQESGSRSQGAGEDETPVGVIILTLMPFAMLFWALIERGL